MAMPCNRSLSAARLIAARDDSHRSTAALSSRHVATDHRAEAAGGRSLERLRAHWQIERELATRLRHSTREQRATLYGALYDELFRRVPDHPQLLRRAGTEERMAEISEAMGLVTRFIARGETFLEIGAGDCALSLAMASHAGKVYAIEVSEEIARTGDPPDNFELVLTDGRSIPVAPGTVDLAYSNQLLEHLHPDDAAEQVENVHRALRPGGRYLCLTPNRLVGPADISQFFEDDVASGFHLREYSQRELRDLFRAAGFAHVHTLWSLRGRRVSVPIVLATCVETAFEHLPRPLRLRLKRARLIQKLLDPGGGVIAVRA
jgi:SAM-dependent methyltransferase